jgi:hypothetical protein
VLGLGVHAPARRGARHRVGREPLPFLGLVRPAVAQRAHRFASPAPDSRSTRSSCARDASLIDSSGARRDAPSGRTKAAYAAAAAPIASAIPIQRFDFPAFLRLDGSGELDPV